MRLFEEIKLSNLLDDKKRYISECIGKESENTLLKADKKYTDDFFQREKIEVPQLKFDELEVKAREENSETIFSFRIPFNGNDEAFRIETGNRRIFSLNVDIYGSDEDDQFLAFDIVDYGKAAEEIKREGKRNIDNIKAQMDYLTPEVELANQEISSFIKDKFAERKNKMLDRERKLKILNAL